MVYRKTAVKISRLFLAIVFLSALSPRAFGEEEAKPPHPKAWQEFAGVVATTEVIAAMASWISTWDINEYGDHAGARILGISLIAAAGLTPSTNMNGAGESMLRVGMVVLGVKNLSLAHKDVPRSEIGHQTFKGVNYIGLFTYIAHGVAASEATPGALTFTPVVSERYRGIQLRYHFR